MLVADYKTPTGVSAELKTMIRALGWSVLAGVRPIAVADQFSTYHEVNRRAECED